MIRPKRHLMKLAERELQFGDRTLIMGILNVTPDSFSDGGQHIDPDRAAAHAIELENAGADIIDIGAESSRPGSARISEAEELHRLIPVLKRLKGKLSVPISVDTSKSAVAAKALENGAEIINDASTLTFDMELAKVVADANAGLILNHMRGTPETWAKLGTMAHPMKSVIEDLEAGINRARRAGIERTRIILDPGLGFGKRGEQNYELIARLGELVSLDMPVLVGPSRKSFLGQQETEDADRATGAAVVASVLHGAHIVRVHNVTAIRAVLQTADSILRSISEEPAKKPRQAAVAPRDVEFSEKRSGQSSDHKPLRPPMPTQVVKPFEERPRRAESGDRPPKRFSGGDDRPPRAPYRDRDDAPPKRFSGGADRPTRAPYRDRDAGPPKRFSGGADRPPRAPYRDRDDAPPKRFSGGSDRPPYKKPFSDRPPVKKAYGEGSARPPYRKPSGEGGDRPPYRKSAGEGSDRPPYKKSFGPGGATGKPPYKPAFKKAGPGGFKGKGSPVRSPRPKRDS